MFTLEFKWLPIFVKVTTAIFYITDLLKSGQKQGIIFYLKSLLFWNWSFNLAMLQVKLIWRFWWIGPAMHNCHCEKYFKSHISNFENRDLFLKTLFVPDWLRPFKRSAFLPEVLYTVGYTVSAKHKIVPWIQANIKGFLIVSKLAFGSNQISRPNETQENVKLSWKFPKAKLPDNLICTNATELPDGINLHFHLFETPTLLHSKTFLFLRLTFIKLTVFLNEKYYSKTHWPSARMKSYTRTRFKVIFRFKSKIHYQSVYYECYPCLCRYLGIVISTCSTLNLTLGR